MKKSNGLKASIIDFRNFKNVPFDGPVPELYSNTYPRLSEGIQKTNQILKEEMKNPSNELKNTPAEFWDEIIKKAETLGIGLVGFAEVDENFIFLKNHASGNESIVLYDNAIVLGMEMRFDAIDTAPSPLSGLEAMRIYAELGIATSELTDFIRSKGYNAIACHPLGGPILYPAMAVKAKLGEIGKQGLLISKKYGPRQRLSLISTNASPLPEKSVESLGIADYCKKCGICSRKCPGGAILEEPLSKKNGIVTRIDNNKCFKYFYETSGCSICIKVCPFHKKGYSKIIDEKGRL